MRKMTPEQFAEIRRQFHRLDAIMYCALVFEMLIAALLLQAGSMFFFLFLFFILATGGIMKLIFEEEKNIDFVETLQNTHPEIFEHIQEIRIKEE